MPILDKRININLDDSVSDQEAMWAVANVVDGGLVSGDEDTYCYQRSPCVGSSDSRWQPQHAACAYKGEYESAEGENAAKWIAAAEEAVK